jgi:hypothetical protein
VRFNLPSKFFLSPALAAVAPPGGQGLVRKSWASNIKDSAVKPLPGTSLLRYRFDAARALRQEK